MKRSVVSPVLVAFFSVVAAGWLMQEGVSRASNVYVHARVLQEVVDRVSSSFVDEVDRDLLYNSAIEGLIRELEDPHSSFLPASEYENLRIRTEGEYGGVGLEVVDRGGYVTVVSPIPGGPGNRIGIRAGDQFYEIEDVAVDTMFTDQVVELLRGRPGTDVTVRMLRPGLEDPIEFTITREEIVLRAVPFSVILDDQVGYVPLTSFRETSATELRTAIDSLSEEGMRSLVLDLRGNPGGLLDQGIEVTDLFLSEGQEIVETRGREASQNELYAAANPDQYPEMPLVILVDQGSASAAEIIAGALQDHDRAILVGETTFGKGSVQSLYRLTGGDVLRLTTAKWYTPVGRSIHSDHDSDLSSSVKSEVEWAYTITGKMVEPVSIEGRPEFLSAGGRTLYGGGGITPDVHEYPETLGLAESGGVLRLFQRGGGFSEALFDYAVGYVADRPDIEVGFSLTNEDIRAFYTILDGSEGVIDWAEFQAAERFVRYHMEREIALQAWGSGGEFHQLQSHDRQLARALGLLREVQTPAELVTAASEAKPEEIPDWQN